MTAFPITVGSGFPIVSRKMRVMEAVRLIESGLAPREAADAIYEPYIGESRNAHSADDYLKNINKIEKAIRRRRDS